MDRAIKGTPIAMTSKEKDVYVLTSYALYWIDDTHTLHLVALIDKP
jgi:hypothetical protein